MCDTMRHEVVKTIEIARASAGMHLVRDVLRGMRAASAGFSLIEILIVVALIAVLAGTAAPIVAEGVRQYAINSAGQQVASTIRAARFQAVARNQELRVRFNYPAAGQYQVVLNSNGTTPVGEVQLLPSGISFGMPTDLQFRTTGRLLNVGAVTFVVTNGNAAQDRTIAVSTSGQVRLQ